MTNLKFTMAMPSRGDLSKVAGAAVVAGALCAPTAQAAILVGSLTDAASS